MSIVYHIFSNSMVINLEGKTFTISKDDRKYGIITDLIKNNGLETVGIVVNNPEGFENYLKVMARLLEALKGYEK